MLLLSLKEVYVDLGFASRLDGIRHHQGGFSPTARASRATCVSRTRKRPAVWLDVWWFCARMARYRLRGIAICVPIVGGTKYSARSGAWLSRSMVKYIIIYWCILLGGLIYSAPDCDRESCRAVMAACGWPWPWARRRSASGFVSASGNPVVPIEVCLFCQPRKQGRLNGARPGCWVGGGATSQVRTRQDARPHNLGIHARPGQGSKPTM